LQLNQCLKILTKEQDAYMFKKTINLALSFPYLAPVLDKEVFEKYDYIGAMEAISDFLKKL